MLDRFRQPKNCRSCHFLVRTTRMRNGEEYSGWLSVKELADGKVEKTFRTRCYMGVWNTQIEKQTPAQLKKTISQRRRDTECYYFPRQQTGLSLPAAAELERRGRELKMADRKRLRTVLLGALAGAVATVLIGYAIATGDRWFNDGPSEPPETSTSANAVEPINRQGR